MTQYAHAVDITVPSNGLHWFGMIVSTSLISIHPLNLQKNQTDRNI